MPKNTNDLTTAEAELRRAQARAEEVRRQYEDARKLDEEWRANRQKLVTLAADDEAAAESLRQANQAAVAARIEFENLEFVKAESERLAAEAKAAAEQQARRQRVAAISARLDRLQSLSDETTAALAAVVDRLRAIKALESQLEADARDMGVSTTGFQVASNASRKAEAAFRSLADDVNRDVPLAVAQPAVADVTRVLKAHWWFTHG